MIWTAELIAKAYAMREANMSMSEISKQIPGSTRGGVAGMFWRQEGKSRAHHDRKSDYKRYQDQKIERILKGENVGRGGWENNIFEPYAVFKARKQRERMEAGR